MPKRRPKQWGAATWAKCFGGGSNGDFDVMKVTIMDDEGLMIIDDY